MKLFLTRALSTLHFSVQFLEQQSKEALEEVETLIMFFLCASTNGNFNLALCRSICCVVDGWYSYSLSSPLS